MEYAQMSKVPSNVEEMKERTEDSLRGLRNAVNEYMNSATARAREAAAYADRRVQSNPWTAVSIGFGVGVVFGVLLAAATRMRGGARFG